MSRSVHMDYELLRERQARVQEALLAPEVVSARDLLGIAPDWTGGMSTEEWIREQRDRG